MRACPACGEENPDKAKFCLECATPLAQQPSSREERKVVSVLFCDLVGSTSLAEGKDPEDVRAVLRPYHELLKARVEGFGGTVEKFIGDAVMAVFGAPVAHEDDAERAVRAGLRILESLEDLNTERGFGLSVRIGVNTGEVVVSLEARPEHGESMVAGDVVNTAARLQVGAPVGGIAVGETTHESTRDVFDYEPLVSLAAKGKAKPLPAWHALKARARFGTDITRRHDVALVGRDAEREQLRTLLERAISDRSCHLVTILGGAGVGKSRMIYELLELVEERDDLVVWRQGRCLPYGEGIAFWALGEIVKAEAGILESDSPVQAEAKLDRALRGLPFEPGELGWVRARLAPLVGVEPPSTAERAESFTAWRRFLEAIAGSRASVFVFEDLHWADPGLLEFLEHVADLVEGVPMLLVCTARPELSERHPSWAGRLRNATTLNLAPLSEEATATLVGELLGRSLLPIDVQRPIVERTGGNPLYAEEFVRMLKDRGMLVRRGQTWALAAGENIPFPEGIHGIISARLDTLTPARKELLQDASVIGKVFWSGALEAMGDRDGVEVREALHELTKKEFLRAARTSSMEGESEYSFWHMLVRDAAYAQITRTARVDKHVAVASWLEGRAGERVEDLADVLAYHSFEALELARAAGGDQAGLQDRALRFLVLAGDRAKNLDPARAEVMYERALSLASEGDPIRGEILHDFGYVEFQRGRYRRSRDLLQEAIPALYAAGKPARAADVKVLLPIVLDTIEPSADHRRLLDEAVVELAGLPPGKELVGAYAMRAGWDSAAGMNLEAIGWADKSLSLAGVLELPDDPLARITRGRARWWSGDVGGLEDIRRGIELALEQGSVPLAVWGYEDLSMALSVSAGPSHALPEIDAGAALARRSGVLDAAESIDIAVRSHVLFALGRWDEVMDAATAYLAGDREDRSAAIQLICQVMACDVSTWRGDLARASELSHDVHLGVRAFGGVQAQQVTAWLSVVASAALATGDVDRAVSVLHEIEAYPNIREGLSYPECLPQITRVALGAIGVEFAHRFTIGIPEPPMALQRICLEMAEAELAEGRGELERSVELYASAEEGWRTFSVPERAQSLLGWGRCLLAMGDPNATAVLREAHDVFASLTAELYLPEVDSLLTQAVARSP